MGAGKKSERSGEAIAPRRFDPGANAEMMIGRFSNAQPEAGVLGMGERWCPPLPGLIRFSSFPGGLRRRLISGRPSEPQNGGAMSAQRSAGEVF